MCLLASHKDLVGPIVLIPRMQFSLDCGFPAANRQGVYLFKVAVTVSVTRAQLDKE